MQKRYRLVGKPVGADVEVPFDGEYSAKEIAGIVFVRVDSMSRAQQFGKALSEQGFNDRKFFVLWGDFEFFALELPGEGITVERIRAMRRDMVERGLVASNPKALAVVFDLTNEEYARVVALWDQV